MNVIELKGLGKTFTDRDEPTIALQDINLTIASGEFVAIIGPSGSGKSTLMNVLGLLDSPSQGDYLLDGKQVAGLSDRQLSRLRRDKIGFVFQSFNLLPRLTVLGNVELPLIYARVRAKQRRQRARDLLKLVGLADRAGYRPNQISGGQTQRVAIARALANNPSLILADEPTGNLDTKSSNAIIEELRRLNRETSATIVIVTHNPDIADLTDRTITVRDGRILSDHHNTQHHRAAAPVADARVAAASVVAKSPQVEPATAEGNSFEQASAGSVAGSAENGEGVRSRENELPAAASTHAAVHQPRPAASSHIIDLRHSDQPEHDDHGDHEQ